MANMGYLTITGERQGLISAGCSTQSSVGNKCQTAHADEIMVLAFVHDMFHNDSSPHATHTPIQFTKNLDKSSPLLSQALANLEKLCCVFDLYRISAYGGQEKFYTMVLQGAVIARLSTAMPHSVLQNDLEIEETVAVRYREIKWTHHIAGTSGYASWDDR